jgi:site-specific recombinase XerD
VLTQQVNKALFWVLFQLSKSLKKRSQKDWEKFVHRSIDLEPSRVHRQNPNVYKAFKQTPLESLAGKGSWVEALRPEKPQVSLPRWAQEIQPFLQNQLSDHTRRAYEGDLKQFFLFLEGRISPEDLKALKPEHIILFRKSLEEGRLTGKVLEKTTVNRKLAVVKSFLSWLKLNQLISENPAELVKGFPQNQESSLKGFSDEEARKILFLPKLNSKAGALHSAILHMLFYMGLRKAELMSLRMGDISEERGVPVLKVRGKGHRVRILPMVPIVKASLEHYFHVCRRDSSQTESFVFTPTKNPLNGILEKPLGPNAITYIVTTYAKKAGVLQKVSPHSCRATCISNALDKKATHRSVQYLAGWSTPLMIQRYDKRREELKNSAAFVVDYSSEEPPKGTALL